jgi:hypothetical protein
MPPTTAPENAPETLEGTWEEIARHADRLNGRRLRVTILPDTAQGHEPARDALDAENAAAIAYLQARLQNAPIDPETIRQAEAELEELHRNLDKNRREAGERPLFPE